MVPIVQQLQNALLQSSPSIASINAFRIRLNSLRKRFDYLKITSLHVVATILDPSTKLSFAEHSITDTSRHFTFDYSKSRQMVISYFIAKVKECDVMNIECHDSPGPSSPKILKLSDFSLRKTTIEVTNNKDSWKKLFECYLDTPEIPQSVDPIKFWSENSTFTEYRGFKHVLDIVVSCFWSLSGTIIQHLWPAHKQQA